jgi:hypothetical protein
MIEGQVVRDVLLRPDVNRVGHPVHNRVAIPAQADDILDETPIRLDRLALVTMKALGRFVHEGVRIPGPRSRCRDKEEKE